MYAAYSASGRGQNGARGRGRGRGSLPVCKYWLEGRCNRGNACNFSHQQDITNGTLQGTAFPGAQQRQAGGGAPEFYSGGRSSGSRRRSMENDGGSVRGWGRQRIGGQGESVTIRNTAWERDASRARKPCKYWLGGKCQRGDSCSFLHTHSTAPDVEMMTQLQGHEKVVRAIALPEQTSLLYTAGQDGAILIWDCTTGQCTNRVEVGEDVQCLWSQSGWLFIGVGSRIKTWIQATGAEGLLVGPTAAVLALGIHGDKLFAGCQDGKILCWQFNGASQNFEPLLSLDGHSGSVISLDCSAGLDRLASGSKDNTVRIWNVEMQQCVQVLEGHTAPVMKVVWWNAYLLSCSLDGTVKVWGPSPTSGQLESVFSHPEAAGLTDRSPPKGSGQPPAGSIQAGQQMALTMEITQDASGSWVLLVAYTDGSSHQVKIYDLPSFAPRGSLFTKEEARSLHVVPGLMFSGDASGEVKVWRWLEPQNGSMA